MLFLLQFGQNIVFSDILLFQTKREATLSERPPDVMRTAVISLPTAQSTLFNLNNAIQYAIYLLRCTVINDSCILLQVIFYNWSYTASGTF